MQSLIQSSIHPVLINTSVILCLVLLIATVIYGILYYRAPSPNVDKIGERIRYLWSFFLVYVIALATSTHLLILYVGFLSFLGFKEFLSITPTRRADRRVLFWAYLAIPIQYFLIWIEAYWLFMAFIPTYLLLFIPLCMVVIGETKGFLRAISTISWGLVTMVYSIGHLAYLLLLTPPIASEVGGIGLFTFVIVLSQISHLAQYIFGRAFRQQRWQLKVTRTRNWASLLGSILTATAVAWFMSPQLTNLNASQSLLGGAAIAFASFVGYLTMSAIKTDLQLKDRGSMTPGHGGVMNRVDVVIYSSPLFFHLVSSLSQ